MRRCSTGVQWCLVPPYRATPLALSRSPSAVHRRYLRRALHLPIPVRLPVGAVCQHAGAAGGVDLRPASAGQLHLQ